MANIRLLQLKVPSERYEPTMKCLHWLAKQDLNDLNLGANTHSVKFAGSNDLTERGYQRLLDDLIASPIFALINETTSKGGNHLLCFLPW